MQINEKIRALREDNDITQDQLAKIAGVSTKQVRRWEQDDSEMGIQKLKLICEYFKVSADYILGLAPDLDWPREERSKKRYTDGCTKYIFLYVKYIATFEDRKAGLSACFYRYCILLWGTYRKTL